MLADQGTKDGNIGCNLGTLKEINTGGFGPESLCLTMKDFVNNNDFNIIKLKNESAESELPFLASTHSCRSDQQKLKS